MNNIKIKKNIYFMLVILVVAVNITACGPENINTERTNQITQNIIDTTNIETEKSGETIDVAKDSNTIESILFNTPPYINKIIDDNFVIDAYVSTPDVSKTDVLFASFMQFDDQMTSSLLFGNNPIPQRTVDEYDGSVLYDDGNSYLFISDGFLRFEMQDFSYVKFPTENFVSSNDIISGNEQFKKIYIQEDLPFMEQITVYRNISSMLTVLSINTAENPEVNAIDFSTMQLQQDKRIQESLDYQKQMGFSPIKNPTDGYQIKDTFTQNDDFYIYYFDMLQSNIPVTQKSYVLTAGERTINGSIIRVSFSENGVIELDCSGIYQQKGVAESPNMIISVEDALQSAYDIRNSIIATEKVTVTSIDFEYVPIPYNSNYSEVKLTPAWSLTMTYEKNESPTAGQENPQHYKMNRMMFIDAITGEEIK